MPAPLGKHQNITWAHAPWSKSAKPAPQIKTKKTDQKEIDICLQCTAVSCRSGECSTIRTFDRAERFKYRPAPKGFYEKATSGLTVYQLAREYGVTEHLVTKWRKEFGLVKSNKPSEIDKNALVRDVKEGMSFTKVKRKYHIGDTRARGLYKELGLSTERK